VAFAAGFALACATGTWDVASLEARYPALRALDAHRLGAATPYLLPAGGVLTLFLCRWPTGTVVPVSLPPDATPQERRLLEAALRAWEGAGLGLRFRIGGAPERGIAIRFAPEPEPGEATPRAGLTHADCAVDAAVLARPPRAVVPARLDSAAVLLRRSERDVRDRRVPHTPEELLGSALHELGHALGFQGHARRGSTVMNVSVDAVRRVGRRVLAGGPFEDAALEALYAVPSGAVVGRVPVAAGLTEPVERLARLARRRGLAGPWVRVGDRTARIDWRDAEGIAYPLLVPRVGDVLRVPASLRVVPVGPAAALLDSAS
jgi:hypothetical protein